MILHDQYFQAAGRFTLQLVRAELGCVQFTRGSDESTDARSDQYRNKNDDLRPRKFHSRS